MPRAKDAVAHPKAARAVPGPSGRGVAARLRPGLDSTAHPLPGPCAEAAAPRRGKAGRSGGRKPSGRLLRGACTRDGGRRGWGGVGEAGRCEGVRPHPPPLGAAAEREEEEGEELGRGARSHSFSHSLTRLQRLVAAPARLSLSRARGLRREEAEPGRGLVPPGAAAVAATASPSRLRLPVSLALLRRTAQQPSGPERHIRPSAECRGWTTTAARA